MRPYLRLLVATSLLATLSLSISTSSGATASSTAPQCSPSMATLSATAVRPQSSPGTTVRVSAALHNRSALACSYATGPFSPNFVLTNSHGVTVWGSCWFGGGPAPCADYLVHRTLAPGATYRDQLSWDGRTGHPERFVPSGRYTFRVNFAGLDLRAATSFILTRPRNVSVTLADSGGHFLLAVGGLLTVRLAASMMDWTTAVSSDPQVLAAVPQMNPAAGIVIFRAQSMGTVQVSSTGNPTCYPQCLIPSRLFSVTVTVVSSAKS